MEDIRLLENVERYLSKEMTVAQRAEFEQLCKENPQWKQTLIEQEYFLEKLHRYAERKTLQKLLDEYDKQLPPVAIEPEQPLPLKGKAKVIFLYNKYKRVTAIAASIAGFTALVISGFIAYIAPAHDNKLQQLSRDVEIIKKAQAYQSNKIEEVVSKIPKGAIVKSGGSAFMIDGKGYFVTNAHVLNGSGAILVNNKGQEFKASIVYIDQSRDLAILKMTDKDFTPVKHLPYYIKRGKLELGQDIFTLGYPRNDIVYNTGYLSAASGFDGDTSTIQLSMMANPGNSGGPVFNENGEIVGVLSTRETKAEGVSFAIKSNEIYQMLDDWKRADTSSVAAVNRTVANTSQALKKENRIHQIKKLESYVYLVKVY